MPSAASRAEASVFAPESANRFTASGAKSQTVAGKTTRVSPATLVSGEVIMLEPRRIAARLAARRVAWEPGEEVGGTVGYQVRFDERIGPRTRLWFVTEGKHLRGLVFFYAELPVGDVYND
ncbi:hypothetical protein [Tunturiibacter gelidiferens]|uniref:hypothetical protein n=1 Tax=Tunturiibacter gelidiferens TaxID=3069689 RepID=UPI003D9AD232